MKKTIMALMLFIGWSAIVAAEPPSGVKGELAIKPGWTKRAPEGPSGQIISPQKDESQSGSNQNLLFEIAGADGSQVSQADTAAETDPAVPAGLELSQNFPNPFNSETEIKYGLPVRSSVHISVYNIFGKKVRTIKDGIEDSGYYSVNWDGRDDNGELLASGMYFYVFASDDNYLTGKMMFLK